MSMGGLAGKPAMKTPQPGAGTMTSFGTYTPDYAVKPIPDSVKNNMNLGWDFKTGQVIQPLSPQQKAAVAIPPINLPPLVKTQPVFPGAVKTNTAGIFSPTQITQPIKPQQATAVKPATSTSQTAYNIGVRR